ncbi:phosphoglucosamine mutase [Paratissierella segnis]|jgi:phosphoglucosamine mutase|uniref:Phosphoglucosamine mutase n=1 Tax=Paratissierella segnis TaxID=2763679 RepID=A0A926IKG4_9FIRM|nr:phosphoglucosamine mutase [Paratissierella segnis]MBC8588270.1 phosphoglucosamine mutase [Paratissierella segnis]
MGKLFGTDGVRGIANKDLTPELAYNVGRAGAYILAEGKKGTIAIGKDTRVSGDMLEAALIAGFCSMGLDVLKLGIIPTPAVAYLTRKYEAIAGVVISASHNPGEYNGIKFFSSEGLKLPDEVEEKIEDIILNNKKIDNRPIKDGIGRVIIEENGVKDYKEYLKNTINVDLTGLKIAIDTGNGALYKIAPEVIRELNGQVILVNNIPDGMNINKKCGSTNPEVIQKLVLDNNADIGLSFDGDGDRIIAVDEKGQLIDGDHILAICGTYLKGNGRLKNNTIVGTIMTNIGLDLYSEENNINIVKTTVGDRYVLEEMLKSDYVIGGEQSGHIIFLEYNTTGDGLATGLHLLEVKQAKKKSMSELNNLMKSYPQVLINAEVDNQFKNKYMEDEEIKAEIERIEKLFKGEGRVVIRPSGTESLIRVMIEGKDQEEITKIATELATLIESKLG